MGAGIGMGMMMPGMMNKAFQDSQNQGTENTAAITCSNCNASIPAGSKFCPACGKPAGPATIACSKCNTQIPQGAKFCPNCGNEIITAKAFCPDCGKEIAQGAKFCPHCGKSMATPPPPKEEQ